MGGPASSSTAEIYMQAHESTAISTALHSPKVWERFVDDVYSIVKRTQLENFFHHINNLHQNIKFTMEEESNGELAFLDTLLKRNNGEISVLVYRKPTHTDQYLHYSSHHQTSCKESVVSSLFNRAYSIITNKDDLHKENARIKQVIVSGRSVRNCDCDKNEIAKHCWEADHNFNWDQKKVVDRESRLIPRKIKETIHSLKNPNHINKISYMLPEIWLPNLR